jgi:hypothetical protein
MSNPVSLILTDTNGNSLQVTGATILTPAERHALGILLSQPISAVLTDHSGNPLQLSSSAASSAWASLTGDLTETQVIPWDGGTVGTPDSGISRIGSASLAIGNGTTGNTSGSLTLSSLYASLVDTVAVTLTGVFTDGTGSVGTNGQVLSSTVTGTKWINAAASGVTSVSGDGTILSNSGSTGAVTLTLENAGQNTVLAGPISGGTGAPTYRSFGVADLPTSGTWAFAGTFSGNSTVSGNELITGTETHGLTSYTVAITNSPQLVIAGSYQSATSTFAEDSWTISDVIGTGTNGTSTLTLTHSGTTGTAAVSVPQLNTNTLVGTTAMAATIASGEFTWTIAGTVEYVIQNAVFRGSNTGVIGFSAGAPNAGGADTAISRVSAGILAIGTGASGSTAGTIAMTTQLFTASASAPTSAGTAGTVGQIIYNGGFLYLCTVTGAAGSATWTKISSTSV